LVAAPALANATQIAAGGGTANGTANSVAITSAGNSFRLIGDTGSPTLMNGGAFWFVNLGARYHVNAVKIYNRTDCCGDLLSNFRVLFSNGAAWVVGSDQTRYTSPASGNVVVPIDVNFDTQYVAIQKSTPGTGQYSDFLNMTEVEVLGSPTSVPAP
jgi:hypothetical protein